MIAVLGATKSCPVKCERQRPGAVESRSHTSNIVPAWLAERIWCTQFQSSLLNIYFRPSGFQSSAPTYPLPLRSEYPFILHQRVTQNLTDMWLSTFVIGAAQLRYVTKVALPQPFLCVNRRLVAAQKLSAIMWTQAKTPRIQRILSPAPSGLREEDGLKNTHWCLSTGFPNLVYVW